MDDQKQEQFPLFRDTTGSRVSGFSRKQFKNPHVTARREIQQALAEQGRADAEMDEDEHSDNDGLADLAALEARVEMGVDEADDLDDEEDSKQIDRTVIRAAAVSQPATPLPQPHVDTRRAQGFPVRHKPTSIEVTIDCDKIPAKLYHKNFGAGAYWNNAPSYRSYTDYEILHCVAVHPDDVCGTLILRLAKSHGNEEISVCLWAVYGGLGKTYKTFKTFNNSITKRISHAFDALVKKAGMDPEDRRQAQGLHKQFIEVRKPLSNDVYPRRSFTIIGQRQQYLDRVANAPNIPQPSEPNFSAPAVTLTWLLDLPSDHVFPPLLFQAGTSSSLAALAGPAPSFPHSPFESQKSPAGSDPATSVSTAGANTVSIARRRASHNQDSEPAKISATSISVPGSRLDITVCTADQHKVDELLKVLEKAGKYNKEWEVVCIQQQKRIAELEKTLAETTKEDDDMEG